MVIPSAIVLSVSYFMVIPSAIMLNVVTPNVVAPPSYKKEFYNSPSFKERAFVPTYVECCIKDITIHNQGERDYSLKRLTIILKAPRHSA